MRACVRACVYYNACVFFCMHVYILPVSVVDQKLYVFGGSYSKRFPLKPLSRVVYIHTHALNLLGNFFSIVRSLGGPHNKVLVQHCMLEHS